MKGKVLFVVGLGVGYVLGTRAGRRRYEQIKSAALRVWDSPAVQKQVHNAQDYAADRIGDLGTVVTEGVKRAVTRSGGTKSTSDSSATSAAKSPAGKASGAKTSSTKASGAKASAAKTTAAKTSSGSKTAANKSSTSSSKSSTPRRGSAGSDGQAS